ncbi:MAG: AMP-binding protein, partial [Pseudacidovorax sp.]|nr:AMP-binding protein [Pseudacidovorax sp.]
ELLSERAYEAPQGEAEQALAAIWSQVLGVERIGRHDNFFELGGDSILSLKVVALAVRAGLHASARQVLEHQLLWQLAQAIVGTPLAPMAEIPALPPALRAAGTVLSYAQQRQWFLWQMDPQSTAYHISGALRLQGSLVVEAVCAAFAALVQRHEALRTVFRSHVDGRVEQQVREAADFDFRLIDLEHAEGREAKALDEAQRLAATPFDLGAGPLLRVGLVRLSAREHLLVVAMHHIVSDGWSMQLIVQAFAAHYRAHAGGAQVPEVRAPVPLAIQYGDYAVWQRRWLEEEGEKARQLAYWMAHLGGVHPVLRLPSDHPRRVDGRYSAARHAFPLPPALVHSLQRRVHATGATLYMALLSCLQILLYRWSGQQDIRVGTTVANRHRPQTQELVGFFVNTQVLRSVLHSRESMGEVLARAKAASLGAQAHQDLPFEQLVEALQPERDLGTSPLFQVMFNHQRGDRDELRSLPGLSLEIQELGAQAAQFELTLNTSEDAQGQVRADFTYAAELFDPQTIERMAGHYLALLRALAEHPEQAVGDVALMDEAETLQLRGWSENPETYEDTRPVHALIAEQARRCPDAVAVVFGETQLSYGELDVRANRLAHRLIALGVGPEVRVGIAVERSLEMVVGLLAVLKAG